MTEPLYRGTTRSCPRCATRLVDHPKDRWACMTCGGLWIGDADMRELVFALAPDLDLSVEVFQYTTRPTQAPLACPACTEPLRPVRFAKLPLDRCDKDGRLWFDGNELAAVLQNIGMQYADREFQRNPNSPHTSGYLSPYGTGIAITAGGPPQWRPGHESEPDGGFIGFVRSLFGKKRPPDP